MCIRDDQPHALQPPLDEAPQECRPEAPIFGRTDIDAEHLALALTRDPDRHDGRLIGDTAIDAHLEVRRVHPEIAVLPGQRTRAERRDRGVQLATDSRHF